MKNELNYTILGEGIYRKGPRYATAKAAHDDLERYARDVQKQSPLYFTVYFVNENGELTYA